MSSMRRSLILFLCVTATLAPATALGKKTPAHVWIASRSPVSVRGAGFAPREHVVLTVTAATQFRRTVVATKTGTFATSFAALTGKAACGAIAVRAAGIRGDVAVTKVPGEECAAPPAPMTP